MEILLVGGNPVLGHVVLCLGKVELFLADHLVKIVLQSVLDKGVPRRMVAWLRPQIADVVRASQAGRNQIIYLVILEGHVVHSIFVEHPLPHRGRYGKHDLVMIHRANVTD
jgi:hypothetical protein